jgi:hypothetical protein
MVLAQTLGCIAGIQNLMFHVSLLDHASRDFHPFQAIADAVNSAHSLRTLHIRTWGDIGFRDPAGIANALREHSFLNNFDWLDFGCLMAAHQGTMGMDPVLRALPACTNLLKVSIITRSASADGFLYLLQLRSGKILHLTIDDPDHWMAVADEIQQGRCRVRGLVLSMYMLSSGETDTAVV